MLFLLDNLQVFQKFVSLHCVFHSIRFKVNKGWSTAVLLFLCPYPSFESKLTDRIAIDIPSNSCFLRMFVPKFNLASLHGIISI